MYTTGVRLVVELDATVTTGGLPSATLVRKMS
jgi:hypothetical protein